jgi:hypothetical protein
MEGEKGKFKNFIGQLLYSGIYHTGWAIFLVFLY